MRKHRTVALSLFGLVLGLFLMTGLYGLTVHGDWASEGYVWVTDSEGTSQFIFDPGQTVYIHWEADGNITSIIVYYKNSTSPVLELAKWTNLPEIGVVTFVAEQKGSYTVKLKGYCTKTISNATLIVNSWFVIPELPLGTIAATVGMFASFGAFGHWRKRLRKNQ